MNQIESLIAIVIIGFIVSSVVAHLPTKVSFFSSGKAKNYFGLAVWMLVANLWPILSKDELINRSGQPMYPFFGYLTVVGFLVFLIIAFWFEKKDR